MDTFVSRLIGRENSENSRPDCVFAVKHQQIVLCEKNGCHTVLKNSSEPVQEWCRGSICKRMRHCKITEMERRINQQMWERSKPITYSNNLLINMNRVWSFASSQVRSTRQHCHSAFNMASESSSILR